jgi:hypothetical protein
MTKVALELACFRQPALHAVCNPDCWTATWDAVGDILDLYRRLSCIRGQALMSTGDFEAAQVLFDNASAVMRFGCACREYRH